MGKDRSKKHSATKLIVVMLLAIFLVIAGIAYIKLSSASGVVSLGMKREEIENIVKNSNYEEDTEQIGYTDTLPFLKFGPKVVYGVEFSVEDNRAYSISVFDATTPGEAQILYDAYKTLLTIKYGFADKVDDFQGWGISLESLWMVKDTEIVMNLIKTTSDSAIFSVKFLDTNSYEYKTIQNDKYVAMDVPAYPGKLLDGFGTSTDGYYIHKGASAFGDKDKTVSEYRRRLELYGFELDADLEKVLLVVYKKGNKYISISEDEEDPNNILILTYIREN